MQNHPSKVPEFKVKNWTAVAMWTYDPEAENCSICKYSAAMRCPECADTVNNCPAVRGKCGHVYHQHCIEHWTTSRNTCPLCSKPWVVVKSGSLDENI